MGLAIATPDLGSALRRYARLRSGLLPYALISPSVAAIAGILAFPLAMLVWLSLQRYGLRELIAHSGAWVGPDNYRTILADPVFLHSALLSFLFTRACLPLTPIR